MNRSFLIYKPNIKNIMVSFLNNLFILLVCLYIHFYVFFLKIFGKQLRGLGFASRTLRHEYVFKVKGYKFWFNSKCAAAYCVMLGGYWNEPETHVFLDSVLAKISGTVNFIDVGASVGEMVIPMAKHNKVLQVTAFEPQFECAHAIEKSAQLNGIKNLSVVPCAASDKRGTVRFSSSINNPTAASISSDYSGVAPGVSCVTVDDIISTDNAHQVIMLIDVEGHEPEVLRGADRLIKEAQPLIIFEYNATSKKYFTLKDIQNILPPSYKFYRLRPNGDGRLDNDLNDTWNCVAVSSASEFADICKRLFVQ